jgi:hypothetical protein
MRNEESLEELEQLASQLGYKVRYEKGDFDGGWCIVKEEKLLLVNKKFDVRKRISVLARCIGEMGVDNRYLKPALREIIEEEMAKDR